VYQSLNASLKDDDDIQRHDVKSLYCATNKLRRGTFSQCSPAVKHYIPCLLHANISLPIVEKVQTD